MRSIATSASDHGQNHPPRWPELNHYRAAETASSTASSSSGGTAGSDIDDFLSGEVQRLAIDGSGGVPTATDAVATPSGLTRFSQNMVAKDLYTISHDERELAMEEIHGVADQIAETPELVSTALSRMEDEIQQRLLDRTSAGWSRNKQDIDKTQNSNNNDYFDLPSSSASDCISNVYERALAMDRDLVQSARFRLPFLRADRFDAEKAAERLLQYFDLKEWLFGTEFLTKPVLMEDLDADSRTRLESGHVQILPSRDLAGRAIFVFFGKLQRKNTKKIDEIRNEVHFSMVQDLRCSVTRAPPESMCCSCFSTL